MESTHKYENFPVWIVVISNLGSVLIYALGFMILYEIGLVLSLLYLTYIVILEYRLIRNHCVDCYYWGKTCGFGKGRLSSLFFKKGDVSRFCGRVITFRDMIPEMLVSLIPVITGIVLLFIDFSLILLMAIMLLILLTTVGNSLIRGRLTCIYCKQKDLGCPAHQLFNKEGQGR